MNFINLNDYTNEYEQVLKLEDGRVVLLPYKNIAAEWGERTHLTYPYYFVGEVDGNNFDVDLMFDMSDYEADMESQLINEIGEADLDEFVDNLRDEAYENIALVKNKEKVTEANPELMTEIADYMARNPKLAQYSMTTFGRNIVLNNETFETVYDKEVPVVNYDLFEMSDNVGKDLEKIANQFDYALQQDYPTGKDGVVEFKFIKDSIKIADSKNTNIIDQVMSEFGYVKNKDYSIKELDGGLFDIVSNTDLTTGSDEFPLKGTKWYYPEQSDEIMNKLKEVFAKNRIAAKMFSEWGGNAGDGSRFFVKIVFNRVVNEK